jgi:hypothetical protein
MTWRLKTLAALLPLAMMNPTFAAPMSQDDMCRIIQGDIATYLATGHPCPCPYSHMRNGRMCGDRSAWAKPGGKAPRCYFVDVDGTLPANQRPNPVRERWPSPPPCALPGR